MNGVDYRIAADSLENQQAVLQPVRTMGMEENAVLYARGLECMFLDDDGSITPVLHDLHLELQSGARLGLLGESGCGKSVTARCMMGIETGIPGLVDGEILVKLDRPAQRIVTPDSISEGRWRRIYGFDTVDRSRHVLRQARCRHDRAMAGLRGASIAMIFQEHRAALDPLLTIGRQLDITLRAAFPEMSVAERRRNVETWLETVNLAGCGRLFPCQLSGGMSQRAMIALALCSEPRILIADEPTTNLDSVSAAAILSRIGDLSKKKGLSVILITHDVEAILAHSTHVAVMLGGTTVEYGPNPGPDAPPGTWLHPYTRFLMEQRRFDAAAADNLPPGVSPADMGARRHGGRCP
ncbi:ABC transporter ATP-binding protein, partial [bacterium]|nr:ABC transporter ATP-binding protein [candidate division CSSED10-310 bacterium]